MAYFKECKKKLFTMFTNKIRERVIETRLCEQIRKLGGYCHKLGMDGWPDRLITLRGRCWYVETKTTGGIVSDLQREVHAKIRKKGFKVFIPYNSHDVDEVVKEIFEDAK